jgi:hypothetical protein
MTCGVEDWGDPSHPHHTFRETPVRRTTLVRGAALLTAATLALSLDAGAATADSTQTEKAVAKSDTAGARSGTPVKGSPFGAPKAAKTQRLEALVPTPADITTIDFADGVLFRQGDNSVDGFVDGVDGALPIDHIDMNLSLNGSPKGTVTLFEDEIGTFVNVLNTVGAGTAQLGPSTIYYSDGSSSVDSTMSNTFQLRRLTKSTNAKPLVINRSGSRITFKAQNWKIFKPATGTYVAMNTIKLQYKDSAGNWLTRKTIELNDFGTGSFTAYTNTKRRYRLYYPTTATILGSRTTTTGLI